MYSNIVRKINGLFKELFRIEIRFLRRGKGLEKHRFSYQKKYVNFNIKNGEKVLDVGSGGHPFPLATHLVDLYSDDNFHRGGEKIATDGRDLIKASVGNLPFKDKEFDFVYCSHLLEHVDNPAKACEEIMRVGKRGYIETPTRISDTMFNFTKIKHHKWYVELLGDTLLFFEYDAKKQRDTRIDDFFRLYHSKWSNPFQRLFHNNRDLFANMLLWENRFYYYVFNQKGDLISSNKRNIYNPIIK